VPYKIIRVKPEKIFGVKNEWFEEINIHVTTQDAKIGDRSGQDATITAGDIVTFTNVNLVDIFFKNANAGSNTVITAYGALMPPLRRAELGV